MIAIDLHAATDMQTAIAYEEHDVHLAAASSLSEEEKVRAYFKDIPVMVKIAYCESRFQHTNPTTSIVTRGRVNPRDLGVMQINETYHAKTATKLNLDLHTIEDNMAYARHLYERQGTQPWSASQPCWQRGTLAMR